MKRIFIFLITVPMVLFLLSCGARSAPVKTIESDLIPVKILPLRQYNTISKVAVSGQFTTDDEVMLSFKTTGIIHQILVKEADPIKKGQLLATLNLTEINASLQQAQLAFDKASRDHQRLVNLYNDSVATLEQVQNAKTTMELAAQQLNSVRFNRNFSEIRAGADGFVLRKLASEGQQISSGTAVFQTNGTGSGAWILRAGVTDKEWAAIKKGDPAIVTIASDEEGTLSGKVSRKAESADPANGLFSIDITVKAGQNKKIATGMFGKALIETADPKNINAETFRAWSVPYEALLDGDGSSGYVFITNDNKKAEKVKVVIAGMEKDHVIVSQGLENARSLIISGSAYLTDQSLISIIH